MDPLKCSCKPCAVHGEPPDLPDNTREGSGEHVKINHFREKLLEECIENGWTTTKIVNKYAAEWRVHANTIRHQVKKYWANREQQDDAEAHSRRSRYRTLLSAQYRRCLDQNNMQAANQVLSLMCKVDNVFAPDTVIHEHGGSVGINISLGEVSPKLIEARLRELCLKYADRIQPLLLAASPDVLEAEVVSEQGPEFFSPPESSQRVKKRYKPK